jgi:hypothetical protein
MSKVISALATLSLGEAAVIDGVRVIRRSLLGFQVAGLPEIVEAAEAAARIARAAEAKEPRRMPAPRPIVRVLVCTRCSGDGLGRRNRGTCGLCHGPGIQVVLPEGGFAEARPEELTSAVEQALVALRTPSYPRARESLLTLLAEALPLAPAGVQMRAFEVLRRGGFAAAVAIEASAGGPRAA